MSGDGWHISFQRTVGEDPSANRGALPFLFDADGAHCLVPLPDGERLWIAVQCRRGVLASALTSKSEPIRQVVVASTEDESLVAFDAILRENVWVPINAPSTGRRVDGSSSEIHVLLDISRDLVPGVSFDIEFATPEHYKFVTGTDVLPTSERDGFQGHRLP